MSWEYKFINLQRDREETVNRWGADGWELVTIFPLEQDGWMAIFKRKKS